MEDLQVQGQGLAITNFLFVMVWSFGYPAYIKFPGQETLDFYPVFTLFNAWMGLCIFIFLGLSSKRFRFVLSRWKKKCMVGIMSSSFLCTDSTDMKEGNKKKDPEAAAAQVPAIPVDSSPGESLATSPSASRPASARTVTTEAPQDEV